MESPLYNKLIEYKKENNYSFHMPGHKNGQLIEQNNLIKMDYTEVGDLDNLHSPNGVIQEAEKRASQIYNTYKTVFLINGSTVGIMASILSQTNKGDKILIARNCHRSVYNAIVLGELSPVYVNPEKVEGYRFAGGIEVNKIEQKLLENSDIKVVVITSPTYEGIVSNIKEISRIVNKYGAILIVDEAHGAHFRFHNQLPSSAIEEGADIVIHSLHKTLPALTQTSLLHIINKEIDIDKIRLYLSMLQTSSPSYVLMGSIDYCMGLISSKKGKQIFNNYINNLIWLRDSIQGKIKNMELIDKKIIGKNGVLDLDISKIILYTKDLNLQGNEIQKLLLKEYKMQMELANRDFILGITTISDTIDSYNQLILAITELDTKLKKNNNNYDNNIRTIKSNKKIEPFIAVNRSYKKVKLLESKELISKDFIIPYPPGIPLLVPGEEITSNIIDTIVYYIDSDVDVIGLDKKDNSYINVIE